MTIVEELVLRAVRDHSGVFSSEGFGAQVQREFTLVSVPDRQWVADVLTKLPYVGRLPGSANWAYNRYPYGSYAGDATSTKTKLSEPYDARE